MSPPVLIVGAARSGSSILYRLLQEHPSFKVHASPIGANMEESHIFEPPFSLESEAAQAFLLHEPQAVRQARALAGPTYLGYLNSLLFYLPFSSRLRALTWQLTGRGGRARAYLKLAQRTRQTVRLLEKTPHHIESLPEIRATLPEALLLYIYRHPLEVFSSYKRRQAIARNDPKTDPSEWRWLSISERQFARLYRRQLGLAEQESQRHPGLFRAVRYEDLVSHPAATMDAILEFLGESVVPLELSDQTSKFSWDRDPHLWGKLSKTTKDWRDFVSQTEARRLEDRLAPLMQRLGYARYTPTD